MFTGDRRAGNQDSLAQAAPLPWLALDNDRSREGRLLDCDPIPASISGMSTLTFSLDDQDSTLRDSLLDNATGCTARILHHLDALGESDPVLLVTGTLGESIIRRDHPDRLEFTLSNLHASRLNQPLPKRARRADFPEIPDEEEGACLPLVYGHVRRVPATLAKSGGRTSLQHDVGFFDSEFHVHDASVFPDGPLRIRINEELFEGNFDGNRFVVSDRSFQIDTATIDDHTGNPSILNVSGLSSGETNAFSGLYAQWLNGSTLQQRLIIRSQGDTLWLDAPFTDNNEYLQLPIDTTIAIISPQQKHFAGDSVRLAVEEHIWIVNDGPSESVESIEVWGAPGPRVITEGGIQFSGERDFVPLPSVYYEVNTNDTISFPALNRPLTTIRMRQLPSEMKLEPFLNDTLRVTLAGTVDAHGTPITRPDAVIHSLLTVHLGIPEDDLDTQSFSDIASVRDAMRCDFALTNTRLAADILQDLAFQTRLALRTASGTFRLVALDNRLPTPSLTLSASDLAISTSEYSTQLDHPITEVVASFAPHARTRSIVLQDEDGITRHGLHSRALDFWAFAREHEVYQAAGFWLQRWSFPYRRLQVQAFLKAIPLEPLDTVTLDWPELFPTPVNAWIEETHVYPARPEENVAAHVELSLRIPTWSGCSSSCETTCESGTCESATCQLACTSAATIACAASCEVNAQVVLSPGRGCTTTCQLACRTAEEDPTPDCSVTCETGCELSCESQDFETTCASGCETASENAPPDTSSGGASVLIGNVITPPSTPFGTVTAQADGATYYTAIDALDLQPATGDEVTLLSYNGSWIIAAAPRDVKFVRVLSAIGDQYYVQEEDIDGNPWGNPFYARGGLF